LKIDAAFHRVIDVVVRIVIQLFAFILQLQFVSLWSK